MPLPVNLEHGDGHLIEDSECILEVRPLPQVVFWRTRVFQLRNGQEANADPQITPTYREVFHYHITGLEKGMSNGSAKEAEE